MFVTILRVMYAGRDIDNQLIYTQSNKKYDIKQSFTFRIDCFFVLFDAKHEMKKLKKWYSNGTVNAKINLIEN